VGVDWQPVAVVIGSVAAFFTALNFTVTHILPVIKKRIDRRSVVKSLVAPSLRDDEIESYCRYYVEPFVQNIDPMGAEEPRALAKVKSRLFKTLDEMLDPMSEGSHIMLLADSGMGKTSALVSYCARHIRRPRRKFNVALILLSRTHALEQIAAVPDKKHTILFLDAFDEDTKAVANHIHRLSELTDAAEDFFRVVITCRAQFFRTDEEIPRQAGILKVAQHRLEKLYLAPFTDRETHSYLNKRYPLDIFRPQDIVRRYSAKRIAEKIPHLSTRPLLLTFIDLLIEDPNVNYACEIYEKMVRWWLEREQRLIGTEAHLERFSELLAVELFSGRGTREEGERIKRDELTSLAVKWGIPIEDKQLAEYQFSTRSLLNRDAEGNYKFAHRSMMEYFYVRHYRNVTGLEAEVMRSVDWTDQMLTFYWEMLESQILTNRTLPFDERNYDGDFILEREQIPFLTHLSRHGLSLLRSPKIASQRLKSILETATALSARIVDPDGDDDPVISLISLLHESDGRYRQVPIAIHHHGRLLETATADLLTNERNIEEALRSSFIPDTFSETYVHVLPNLVRLDGQWRSFTMPIKHRGRLVAVLLGGTSRPLGFTKNHQIKLIEALCLIGKYLDEYSEEIRS
jgi:hypothetical protein